MKWLRPPLILFAILAVALLTGVGLSSTFLPERVATHFNFAGEPDGWMTCSSYLLFMCGFGVGMPLFLVGMFMLGTVMPDWMVNLPHKEFWLSPAMRRHTNDWLVQHGFRLGCLMLLFLGGMHVLTMVANRSVPVRLPSEYSTSLLAGFLVLMTVWIVGLLRHFRNPHQVEATAFERS